jgi:hypothetical protein
MSVTLYRGRPIAPLLRRLRMPPWKIAAIFYPRSKPRYCAPRSWSLGKRYAWHAAKNAARKTAGAA